MNTKLSKSQESIHLTSLIYESSTLFNIGGYARFTGNIQISLLEQAITLVLCSCDVIDQVNQALGKKPAFRENEFALRLFDFSDKKDVEEECLSVMENDMGKAFSKDGELVSIFLMKAGAHKYFWYTKMHHLLSDGYSMSLFFQSVLSCYKRLVDGEVVFKWVNYPYSKYLEFEKEYFHSNAYAQDQAFWLDSFKDYTPSKSFESCMRHVTAASLKSQRKQFGISRDLFQEIENFCRTRNVTPFNYFVGAIQVLEACHNGQNEMVIGLPLFNRSTREFKRTLGTFVNVMPLRTKFSPEITFGELIENIRRDTIKAYKHQRFPLSDLLDSLSMQGNLYNVAFSYQKNAYRSELDSVKTEIFYLPNGEQESNLTFHLLEYLESDDLVVALDYHSDLFDMDLIDRLLEKFEFLLKILLHSSDKSIREMSQLNNIEKQLIDSFNPTPSAYPGDNSLVELFRKQVFSTPDKVAVKYGNTSLTYKELDEYSNRFANYLAKKKGIGYGEKVGLQLNRSERMIVAIWGVLKLGGTYVPLNMDYPEDRLNLIINDCSCSLIVAESSYETFLESEEEFDSYYQAEKFSSCQPVYVIYTSGSTGEPKGVLVENRSVVRLVKNTNYVSLNEEDVLLSLSNFSFDGSVFDIFGALLNGATLVIQDKDILFDMAEISRIIHEERITTLFITTALFNALLDSNQCNFKQLKTVLFGGELVSCEHVKNFRKAYPWVDLIHVYGPTENTTFSTWYKVPESESIGNTIPIGKAISNSRCLILNEDQSDYVPLGVIGEIYLGGDGLAIEYLGKSEMTHEKFIQDPWNSGERLYKTGDYGRWLSNGNIEFIGRKDGQVKVRGFRIELGEIEAELRKHQLVSEACVIIDTEAMEKEITGYVVCGEDVNLSEIKDFLAERLPYYMLPENLVSIPQLPLNANGKVNKSQLPKPALFKSPLELVLPNNGLEIGLLEIWKELLGKEAIGVTDNFFELGGHSIRVARLAALIADRYQVKIPLSEIYRNPTVRLLSKRIDEVSGSVIVPITPAQPNLNYDLSYTQLGIWLAIQKSGTSSAYNVPLEIHFDKPVNINLLERVLQHEVLRHEALRTSIKTINGIPKQCINPSDQLFTELRVKYIQTEELTRDILHRILLEEVQTPIEMNSASLFRALLIQGEDRAVLFLTFHHIIADGWSVRMLENEIRYNYQRIYDGGELVASDIPLQYKDFIAWQRERIVAGELNTSKEFWKNYVAGIGDSLILPYDYDSTTGGKNKGGSFEAFLDRTVLDKLKMVEREIGIGLFTFLTASFHIVLKRITSQEHIVTATPTALRDRPELTDVFGNLLNTLLIKSNVDDSLSFSEYLRKINETIISVKDHQDYPFEKLIEDVSAGGGGILAVSPVFLNLLNFDGLGDAIEKNSPVHREFDVEQKFHLNYFFEECENGLRITCLYRRDLFHPSSIEYICSGYVSLIQQILANIDGKISDFQVFKSDSFSVGKIDSPIIHDFEIFGKEEISFIERFDRIVLKYPNNLAVKSDSGSMSYAQLSSASDSVYEVIKQAIAGKEDERVSLLFEHNHLSIITMLGALKAGCIYVPMDALYPYDRLLYMLQDSKSSVLFTNEKNLRLAHKLVENCGHFVQVINVESDLSETKTIQTSLRSTRGRTMNGGYVLYTSGSTGHPKGVLQTVENIVHFIRAYSNNLCISVKDRLSLLPVFSFDAAIMDIYGALLNGASLHFYDLKSGQGIQGVLPWLKEEQITIYHSTPTVYRNVFNNLNNCIDVESIRLVVLGGEPVNRFDVENYQKTFSDNCILVNGLGPTESTVTLQNFFGKQSESKKMNVPVGKPVQDTSVYVVDEALKIKGVFEVGELVFGSKHLALAYLNQDELTKEKFMDSPFKEGDRIYRSGDLGRWLPDGTLEFVGRRDNQLKIRGNRVEPGEIEGVLKRYEGIREALVLPKDSSIGETRLVAYFISEQTIEISELRNFLKGILPSFMLPFAFVKITDLPLNPNGKIDKEALPEPADWGTRSEYSAPSDNMEIKLAAIWQDILRIDNIGSNDDFFDLGGHSLSATILLNRIYKEFDLRLEMSDLFNYTNLKDQAILIKDKSELRLDESPTESPTNSIII